MDELSEIMGQQATADSTDEETDCLYSFANFSALDISTFEGDLEGVRLLLGKSAKDLVIGGLPAISGVVFGQNVVYVQNGESQLSVLGVLMSGSHRAVIARLVRIAEIAVPRWVRT